MPFTCLIPLTLFSTQFSVLPATYTAVPLPVSCCRDCLTLPHDPFRPVPTFVTFGWTAGTPGLRTEHPVVTLTGVITLFALLLDLYRSFIGRCY